MPKHKPIVTRYREDEKKETVILVIGWLHQLCAARKVHLRKAPQMAILDRNGEGGHNSGPSFSHR